MVLRNVFFLSICSFVLIACGGKQPKEIGNANKRPTPKVDGYVVKTESFAESIEVPGTLVSNETTEIHPEVSGRITYLNVAEGRYVAKGTLLAKLYDADLQAQLKKLQIQQSIAKNNEDRAAQLLKIQGISQQDYDAALLNLRNIGADMDIVRTQIARTEIRAPFGGRLGLRNISQGAYVTPSSVIAVINQTNDLKLDFSVPEKHSSDIYNGQVVDFTIEGNEKQYGAKVIATASSIATDNRSLVIRASVIGNPATLIPGSFAKVQIRFNPNNKAIFVPSQSIVPTARGKQVIIATEGKALFTNVETGYRDSSRVEITKGLKVGDTILVTGIMATKPNVSININKIIN